MVRKGDRGESDFASWDRVLVVYPEGVAHHVDPLVDEEPRGGEASWLCRLDVDDQGFLAGWMERACEMRARFQFDAAGYLCSRDGARLELQQLAQLDPAVQLVARARLALGDVEVLPGDGIKRQATHVQLSAQRCLWEKLTTWSARIRATRIYTLDGGWRVVKTDRGATKIATRAAIDHEGRVLGGRICEEDVNEDNYIAELAAQLDALTDATSRGTEERIIIVFDATSPVRAMLRFGRLSARARGDRLAAELLEHFERLRRRVAALVLIWQTSHVGEPRAVDVTEHSPPSGVCLDITAPDTPLLGARPFDTAEGAP
jgi:ribonuclease HI